MNNEFKGSVGRTWEDSKAAHRVWCAVNARKTELAKDFVTPNIVYHSVDEKVSGLEEFKKWVGEDLSAFSDMHVTILDTFGKQNKLALR